jgi:Nif-specific regulatory protein
VRELENCVERACVIGKGRWIQAEDLFLKPSLPGAPGERNLKTAVNTFKRQYIHKILMENNYNQTETARVLDIQRTYLSRLIKELEIINPKEQ